jgi:hypothetical protein
MLTPSLIVAVAAISTSQAPIQLDVAFPRSPIISPALAALATAEAARVWAPYGVVVQPAPKAPCGWTPDNVTGLTVVTRSYMPGTWSSWNHALGSIRFDAAGAPTSEVFLYVDDVQRFVASMKLFGLSAARWPPNLFDVVVGRALGRALAHEIGHYVLRSTRHSSAGLMRPIHSMAAFADPDGADFALAEDDAARLRAAREQDAGVGLR